MIAKLGTLQALRASTPDCLRTLINLPQGQKSKPRPGRPSNSHNFPASKAVWHVFIVLPLPAIFYEYKTKQTPLARPRNGTDANEPSEED